MMRWLRELFPGAPAPFAGDTPTVVDPSWDGAAVVAWCLELDRWCRREGPAAFEAAIPALRPGLDAWYASHPIVVRWKEGRETLSVADPLSLTTDHLIWRSADEERSLAPWTTLVRSFVIETSNVAFHHGCDLRDVITLLAAQEAPARIVHLEVPSVVDAPEADVDVFVDRLCDEERFGDLRHLVFRGSLPFQVRHIERLASAPWAASLQSLDFNEQLVDWPVDREPSEYHRALRALGAMTALEHLDMTNNIGSPADLAVFLERSFPALKHFEIGVLPAEDAAAFRKLLAQPKSLPRVARDA